jgi:hypothetical protein
VVEVSLLGEEGLLEEVGEAVQVGEVERVEVGVGGAQG